MTDSSRFPLRPFRFGIQVERADTRAEWVTLARRAEELGYAVMTMPDHFTGQLAPIPALQCAADATTTLRVGALVHGNDYKHPVVLAKELATLDLLSDGRLEIGLGAGWMVTDYEQAGIAYDSPGVRVNRMIEAVRVIRGALGEGPFSFDGEHYRITGYDGSPMPTQRQPPMLIGGGGRRMLTFAAEHADIVGVNATLTSGAVDQSTFATMTPEAVDDKIALVADVAERAGRLDAIELNIRAFIVSVTDDAASAIDTLAEFTGAPRATIEHSPFALIGTTDEIAAKLVERRRRWGFSYVIVGRNDLESFAPVVSALAGT